MEKEDLILQMVQEIKEKNEIDHKLIYEKIGKMHLLDKIDAKGWAIIVAFGTTVCTAAVSLAKIIFG
jgi:hypothetical protein